ncbi:hypothetical protein vBAfQDWS535_56 [Alcaligenes phage vB_Af_QDWS535]|nr:hypothetical protein vBAfQDWS535_56 [Alcaligenes phage vB_Af_QDWS535]
MEIKETFVCVTSKEQAAEVIDAYRKKGAKGRANPSLKTSYVRCDLNGYLCTGTDRVKREFTGGYTELSLYDIGVLKGHVHAELMAQYAKDAAETDKPWAMWQYAASHSYIWKTLDGNPAWHPLVKYRRKPVDVFYRVSYTLDKLGMPQFSLHVGQKDTPSIADNRWEGSETKWATGVMPFPVDVPRAARS